MRKVVPIVLGLLLALLIMLTAKCAVDSLDEQVDPVGSAGVWNRAL